MLRAALLSMLVAPWAAGCGCGALDADEVDIVVDGAAADAALAGTLGSAECQAICEAQSRLDVVEGCEVLGGDPGDTGDTGAQATLHCEGFSRFICE